VGVSVPLRAARRSSTRLRRGGADVDLLGIGPRGPQQPRRHEVIVQNDVRGSEILQSADGDQPWIAGAGADQVHDAHRASIAVVRRSSFVVRGAPFVVRAPRTVERRTGNVERS